MSYRDIREVEIEARSQSSNAATDNYKGIGLKWGHGIVALGNASLVRMAM